MKRHNIARSAGIMAVAAGLALGTTGQATAASQFALTYVTNQWCVGGTASMNANATSSAWTYGYKYGNGVCTLQEKPAGRLSVEQSVLWYDMPAGVWVPCFKAGPARNPAGTFGVGYESTGHCGLGRWHASFTAAYAWDGTAWRGAWVGSNNEWLPAPSAASTDSPSASSTPKPKISAADALKRGEVRLGSPDGPKVTAAELHKPPSVRGDAPVEPVEPVVSDGTHTVRTLTAR